MQTRIQKKIDLKTKPPGSLGKLEKIAVQICTVQQSLNPILQNPTLLIFAADHGIAKHGVSAYPSEVTAQMVQNFLNGGAAINVFCKQNNITLKIVDAGVNYDFVPHPNLIDAKIAKGTQNYIADSAMTILEVEMCFAKAEKTVDEVAKTGCNVLGFGEMGIGNTSSASLIMSALTSIPLVDCVGKGTGLNAEQLKSKLDILTEVQLNHSVPKNPMEVLSFFGGFEIAQMCGAMLQAYRKNMLILVDGFIATAAYLCAVKINSEIALNSLFCHESNETGHKKLLYYLNADPILHLDLRLGEGTGCALAYPIIKSAVNFMNEMSSFESAGVSNL